MAKKSKSDKCFNSQESSVPLEKEKLDKAEAVINKVDSSIDSQILDTDENVVQISKAQQLDSVFSSKPQPASNLNELKTAEDDSVTFDIDLVNPKSSYLSDDAKVSNLKVTNLKKLDLGSTLNQTATEVNQLAIITSDPNKIADRGNLKSDLSSKLMTLKLLSSRGGKVAQVKVNVPEVRNAQIRKEDDKLIVSFKDIFYSSNILSKLNLFLFSHRYSAITAVVATIVILTVAFSVAFGYFKKYNGYFDSGDFFTFPGFVPGDKEFDPATDSLFLNQGNSPSFANVPQWGDVNFDAPINNYNGQLYLMGNSSTENARDGLDVRSSRWGAVHRDKLLYKYSTFDGPIMKFGNYIKTMKPDDFIKKFFVHKFYVKKTKKYIFPGQLQGFCDALKNHLLGIHVPFITFDDRFKLNDKKEVPGRINKMTSLIYTVLAQGTVVQNSIGLPVSITGGGDDGNAYLRDSEITWVDANTSQGKYKKHSALDLKKHPEISNDFFTNYIKNSFSVHKSLITGDGRLGPANVANFPLTCLLDQKAYFYPALGGNATSRVPTAKFFCCASPLTINQIINLYYWVFSKQSDSIHDNNYWDDSNIHK